MLGRRFGLSRNANRSRCLRRTERARLRCHVHYSMAFRMPGKATPLLERDRELAALEGALALAARGRGSIALVAGPAGIGKTRLVDAAIETAPRHGLRA